jgi:hypothetical protein
MSEFKGTPGPWDYGWRIQPNGCPTVGHKGLMVCMVAHSAKVADQREIALANASLISAAPDLLEALAGLVEYVDRMHEIGHIQRPVQSSVAVRAIAKALASNS